MRVYTAVIAVDIGLGCLIKDGKQSVTAVIHNGGENINKVSNVEDNISKRNRARRVSTTQKFKIN